MIMELKDKTAIITGASGKLGSQIALTLAGAGCNCVCHYHKNAERADDLVTKINTMGQKAIAVQADLANPADIEKLFARAKELPISTVLVNSAALFAKEPTEDISYDRASQIIDTNLIVPILISAAFVKSIPDRDTATEPLAKIINMVDIGAIRPWAGYTMYCASKAGLIAATKSMAKEYAPAVCVNAIAPGVIAWPEGFTEKDKARQLSMVPAARSGKISDITSTLMFLLQNDYITGQVINVDGGRCI